MIKKLNIVLHPNPILRNKSTEIDLEKLQDSSFQEFLLDMEKTMVEEDGAGLAAPQIGKNIRVIIVNNNRKNLCMINPVITKRSWSRDIQEEGCLSVRNEKGEIIYGKVERNKKINCYYYDKEGKKIKLKASNLLARVIQHEIDHLDGILFIDKVIE